MAGLFGFFDYTKPGAGIGKGEPQKRRFFLFFDILIRKFWDLMKINMLYFLSIILFFIPLILVMMALGNKADYIFLSYVTNGNKITIINPSLLLYTLPIILTGPATAGFTFIMRNFAKEEHAFLWMDYKDTIKKNWKQSLGASFINIIVGMILLLTIPFYYQNSTANKLFIIPLVLCSLLAVVFLFMQYYIYVMIITFDLSLKQIYKNAFIFAFMGLGRNILITIIIGILSFFAFILPKLGLLFSFLFLLSFCGFLINFATWPLVQKLMIDPYNKASGANQEDSIFKDQKNGGGK